MQELFDTWWSNLICFNLFLNKVNVINEFQINYVDYIERKPSDKLKLVTGLAATNQSALFQNSYAEICLKC